MKGKIIITHVLISCHYFLLCEIKEVLVSFADGSCELHKQTLTLCSSTNQSQPTSNLSEYLVFGNIFCREGYASILQGHLTYLAPELMRTLIRNGSTLSPRERNTEGTNVYAFR